MSTVTVRGCPVVVFAESGDTSRSDGGKRVRDVPLGEISFLLLMTRRVRKGPGPNFVRGCTSKH